MLTTFMTSSSNACALKRLVTIIPVLGILILASCSSLKSQKHTVDYFADNAYSNAVATVQHPAGEYYKGVTYVAYQGPLEDPYVAAYDHTIGRWSGPFKAGESILGKTPGAKIDNHGKPAMVIDDAGYIHLVFGGHGGLTSHGTNPLGDIHNGQQIHVVTKKPLDISSWEVLDNIPPFGTYSQFVKMDNGDIYCFIATVPIAATGFTSNQPTKAVVFHPLYPYLRLSFEQILQALTTHGMPGSQKVMVTR